MAEKNSLKPRKKPIQKRSKITVDAIYEAALQLFTQEGYSAITTDKIARRAGVSIGTLYQYFPNKESILVGMWEQVFDAVVIGGTTHTLPRRKAATPTGEPNRPEDSAHVPPGPSENIMKDVTGLYTGVLSGMVSGNFLYLKHAFRVKCRWIFDVGEENLRLDIEEVPVIDKISGKGDIDPYTGHIKMIFHVPVLGNIPGTGHFSRDRRFAFHMPRVKFSLTGRLAEDSTVSGVWEFGFSIKVMKMEAEGDMSGALLPASGQ